MRVLRSLRRRRVVLRPLEGRVQQPVHAIDAHESDLFATGVSLDAGRLCNIRLAHGHQTNLELRLPVPALPRGARAAASDGQVGARCDVPMDRLPEVYRYQEPCRLLLDRATSI